MFPSFANLSHSLKFAVAVSGLEKGNLQSGGITSSYCFASIKVTFCIVRF